MLNATLSPRRCESPVKRRPFRADIKRLVRPPDSDARAVAAAEAVGGAPTPPAVLSATCRGLVEFLGAEACAISRCLGELLVQIEDAVQPGRSLIIGQGYVLSDFPATREVLESGRPKAVSVFDPEADPAETALLRELDFEALLMVPLEVGGHTWGLVEVYDAGERRFSPEDADAATRIVEHAGARLAQLGA